MYKIRKCNKYIYSTAYKIFSFGISSGEYISAVYPAYNEGAQLASVLANQAEEGSVLYQGSMEYAKHLILWVIQSCIATNVVHI